MGLILREKAEYLATFRWLEVFLMETLARWVPTTPELEVKVLMGRHIWDAAQHADAGNGGRHAGQDPSDLRRAASGPRLPIRVLPGEFRLPAG